MTDDVTPFQRACVARGWDQPAAFLQAFDATARLLGEPVTVTERQQRRWRQPDPPQPRARAWAVLQAMFGTDPSALGFRPRTTGETITPTRKEARVERRAFVADAVSLAAGAALPRGGHEVGSAHVLELREGLRSLYALDDAYGGADVLSLAVRHLHRVRRVLNTAAVAEPIARQLQLLVGETAKQVAWLAYDADDQDAARRYWGEALTTATVLGDTGLEVLVLAALSMQAIHEDRPRDGYDLAHTARSKAEGLSSPTLLSLITTREARALARMRDATAASRQLATAMRMLERTDRGRPAPPWAAFHGPAELDFAQGLLYADTGRPRAAVPFLRAAVTRQAAAYGRNRALYRLTLARALVNAGEADEAASEATAALDDLAEVDSGRVTRRLAQVRGQLQRTDARSAREAVEAITPYLTTTSGGHR